MDRCVLQNTQSIFLQKKATTNLTLHYTQFCIYVIKVFALALEARQKIFTYALPHLTAKKIK